MTDRSTPSQKGQNLLAFYKAGKEIPKDDYKEADLRGAHCPNIEMIHHDLTRLNAQKSILNNAHFLNCNLHQANFQFSQLNEAELTFSHLEGCRFGGSKGADINFQQSNLRRANLHQTFFWRANFTLATLEYADCAGADLRWSDFRGCNLRHCNFRGATLIGAVFNEQTITLSGWTETDRKHFIHLGAIWQKSTVQHTVHSEGIQIHTTADSPPQTSWFLETLAIFFECNISVLGTGNNLFLRFNKKGRGFELAEEIGLLSTLPERSILQKYIHNHQIDSIHKWLKVGATITLWEKKQDEIILVETWTHEDAIEVKE